MGLQSGIMAGDELSPRPGRFSVSMEVLEPEQGCPGVTVVLGLTAGICAGSV